ncbi:MAG: hypothetical protein V8S87_04245 [Oscillospiraceae bacterium]
MNAAASETTDVSRRTQKYHTAHTASTAGTAIYHGQRSAKPLTAESL